MIAPAVTANFKLNLLERLLSDQFKIALFTSAADLSADTTEYTATGEASGTGYTAGGMDLEGIVAVQDGEAAYLDWTTDPVWIDVTITARGALIYNASQANKAVGVLDFGQDISSFNAPFVVELPAQVIRIS